MIFPNFPVMGKTPCMRFTQPNLPCLSAAAFPVIVLAMLVTMLPGPIEARAQQLSCSPSNLQFGNVALGQTETLLVALTNSGQTSVSISKVTMSSRGFKVSNIKPPQTLGPGQSIEIPVTFAPLALGSVNGGITFASNASDANLTLNVAGSAVNVETVSANPPSISFGSVTVGERSTRPVVLTNRTGKSVTLTAQRTTGSAFSVTGAKFPLTLAAGQKQNLNVTFSPRAAGLTGGSSFISGPALDIPLEGTGTAASKTELTISPATLNFGNVAVGANGTVTAELIASGGSVTVSSVSSGSSQFTVANVKLPLTVPAGQHAYVNVTFAPREGGKSTGRLTFVSNAADSPTSESMRGTGTTPYVTLSWNASTSQGVTGYNVYRKTTGSYSRINSKIDQETTYTDSRVTGGTTYYYATTAVNSSGKESSYSSPVEVKVP